MQPYLSNQTINETLISRMVNPLVSVIIPAFNSAAFVAATIESILAQSFKRFELILVDDGSTDETPQLLKTYANLDSRIVIVTQQNSGVSAARNAGMLHARADLVAFLDHDDLATPRRLELQVAFLEAYPDIGLLGGAMEQIDVRGRTMGIRYVPPADDAAIRDELESGSPIVTPSVMARKANLLRVGGFRSQYEASDDYDLWLRLMPYIKFANLSDILIMYRVHSSSLSRSRILYYALTTPAAQAAARLRLAGKPDPTEGIPHLTPDILLALGIDAHRTVDLQATALVSYASKMVACGATHAAGDLLEQLETLNLWPTLRSRIAPEAVLVRVRIFLHHRKYLSAFWVLAEGLLCWPSMFYLLGVKVCRLACRLTSKVGRTLCRR